MLFSHSNKPIPSHNPSWNVSRCWCRGETAPNLQEGTLALWRLWIHHKPQRELRKQDPKLQAAKLAKACGDGWKEEPPASTVTSLSTLLSLTYAMLEGRCSGPRSIKSRSHLPTFFALSLPLTSLCPPSVPFLPLHLHLLHSHTPSSKIFIWGSSQTFRAAKIRTVQDVWRSWE